MLFAKRRNDLPKAEAALAEAHKNIPRDEAFLPLAVCHEALGQIDRAKELYEAARAAKPNDPKVLISLASYHLRRSNHFAGEKQREQAKQHLEQAKQYLEKASVLKISPAESDRARQMLAMLLSSSGDYQQTKRALEELLSSADQTARSGDLSPDANLADERAKAVILSRQSNPGQRRKAIDIFTHKMAQRQPFNENDQLLLAQLHESVGEWREARTQMLVLLTSTEAKLAKAGQGSANQANLKATFLNYLTQFCGSLLREGRLEDAQSWFAKLESREPATLRTVAIKARLLSKQGAAKDAVAPLTALADKDPSTLQPVAGLLEEIGEKEEAEKMFRRFVSESASKSPESVLALAQFLGRQDRAAEALAVCEKAWQTCKSEAVAGTSVLILYTAKSASKENWQQVAAWLEKESKIKPKDTVLLGYLAAVRRLGVYDGAGAVPPHPGIGREGYDGDEQSRLVARTA